eukprot:PhM_4_TR3484/c1_g1_i1/m.14761/K02728/PSMA4; 20S proteasome subunit alpha 3
MSRYDSRTTMFSPEGRVYQVEYAMEAILNAGAALGILTKSGIVLAAEKRVPSPLLDVEKAHDTTISGDKIFKVDTHLAAVVAGMTSDANILIHHARTTAQRHLYTFHEGMPVESMALNVADIKQWYTQSGGQRPFGVAFLLAGWDAYHGYQLYHTDPSGNYSSWKAHAIGNNSGTAQSLLKSDWSEDLTLHQGIMLALKIMGRTLDISSLTSEKIELGLLTETPTTDGSLATPRFRVVGDKELAVYLDEAAKEREKEDKAAAAKEKK